MTSLLVAGGEQVTYYPLEALRPRLATPLERLPITVKVLAERGGGAVDRDIGQRAVGGRGLVPGAESEGRTAVIIGVGDKTDSVGQAVGQQHDCRAAVSSAD